MKIKKLLIIVFLIMFPIIKLNSQLRQINEKKNINVHLIQTGNKYMGQKPPGLIPEIFAPGLISIPGHFDFAGTFSPDLNEYFFTRRDTGTIDNRIYYSRNENGKWTIPELAPFAYDCFEFEPHISPDGNQLFFGSKRPTDKSGELASRTNIWVSDKTKNGWSKPGYDGPPFDEAMFVCMSNDGTLYNSGLSKSEKVNGKYAAWEPLARHLSGPYMHPCIGKQEEFIIFDTDHDRQGLGKSLLISFKQKNGKWGKIISFRKLEDFDVFEKFGIAMLSPDGKYLFFTSNGDIYWVDAKVIEDLRF